MTISVACTPCRRRMRKPVSHTCLFSVAMQVIVTMILTIITRVEHEYSVMCEHLQCVKLM